MLSRGNIEALVEPIIHKDSLFFTDEDRELLAQTISDSAHQNIIIIHGTDTMEQSANFLSERLHNSDKNIIFVGTMKPYSISHDEAIFNLSLALGYLNANIPSGIYISMHGLVLPYDKIGKNRDEGAFRQI